MIKYEVAFKLDNNLEYYHNMLVSQGFDNVYNCHTKDIYWSNKKFDEMSEEEIKDSCVRFRYSEAFGGTLYKRGSIPKSGFQHYQIFDNLAEDNFMCFEEDVLKFEKKFQDYYWKCVFKTEKDDYQYEAGGMKSRIQLQIIDEIGLVLYYDNPDYYEYSKEEQKRLLIAELNNYGFSFSEKEKNIDKLRSLYFKKLIFS